MGLRFQSIFKKHQLKHLVELKRGSKGLDRITGFIVDFSDSLVLLHCLNWDTFRLNGYTVIREDDISHYRFFDKPAYWQFRAAKLLRFSPGQPTGVSIGSFHEFLTSVAKRFPLVMFHPERTKPETCYVGSVSSVTDRTVVLDDLSSSAEWTGPRRLKLADITKVDFGGGYEESLAMTVPARTKQKRRKTS